MAPSLECTRFRVVPFLAFYEPIFGVNFSSLPRLVVFGPFLAIFAAKNEGFPLGMRLSLSNIKGRLSKRERSHRER